MSNMSSNRHFRPRVLGGETLESRCLLAADVFAFQNPVNAMDVTHDSFVTPADALAIVNTLNGFDLYGGKVGAYLDTTGDSAIAPNDVISIINLLNGAPDTNLGAMEVEFQFASEYCEQNFENIPEGLRPAAQRFIDLTNNFENSKLYRDAAIAEFLDFSLDNNAAIQARYNEIEVATGVINHEYRSELHEIGTGLTELVDANYPTHPSSVDEYPGEYDFDPESFDDIDDVFNELFNEIDDVLDEIEVPDYGDVIDNFDDVFQTYDDTEFELRDFVGDYLETDSYEEFVLEGHDISELIINITDVYDTGGELDEFAINEFGDGATLINLLHSFFDTAYIGELIFNDVVAIGGETTGSVVILGDGSVVEIDFADNEELLALAERYDNTNVLIEGVAGLVDGVEIPRRTVITVTSLVGQDELDALQLPLASDSTPFATAVLTEFDGILNF